MPGTCLAEQDSADLTFWDTAAGEARHYLPPDRRGFFAIFWRTPERRQWCFPLSELEDVLDVFTTMPSCADADIYISQGVFRRPNRRKANLSFVSVVFLDIDYYSVPELATAARDHVVERVLERCDELEIPRPSLVIDSGRGLQLKWLHEPISAPKNGRRSRWDAVEDHLADAFADLGADSNAKDVSRVLRVVGTRNQKNQRTVRVLPVTRLDFDGNPQRFAFDDLANSVLPHPRSEIHEWRKQRAERRVEQAKPRVRRKPSKKTARGLPAFNPLTLARAQVADYRKLARLMPADSRPEGWTDECVWLAASALAIRAWGNEQRYRRALGALAAEIAPHWSEDQVASACCSVRARLLELSRGEWREYRGRMYPPVYTPKHSTIISKLSIAPEVQRELTTIIGLEERRRRDAERQRKRRADAGSMSRSEYLAAANERRAEALRLHGAGLPSGEIAKRLNVSTRTIRNYLRSEAEKCVRISGLAEPIELSIAPEVQGELTTIIGLEERRRRDAERERKRRSDAGSMSRSEYLAAANERRTEVLRLHSAGLTSSEIAKRLNVSTRAIGNYLRSGAERCVRISGVGEALFDVLLLPKQLLRSKASWCQLVFGSVVCEHARPLRRQGGAKATRVILECTGPPAWLYSALTAHVQQDKEKRHGNNGRECCRV